MSRTFVSTSHPLEVISERRLSSNQVREYSHLCRGHIDVKDGRIQNKHKVKRFASFYLPVLIPSGSGARAWSGENPEHSNIFFFSLGGGGVFTFSVHMCPFLTVSCRFVCVVFSAVRRVGGLVGISAQSPVLLKNTATLCPPSTAHWLQMLC